MMPRPIVERERARLTERLCARTQDATVKGPPKPGLKANVARLRAKLAALDVVSPPAVTGDERV